MIMVTVDVIVVTSDQKYVIVVTSDQKYVIVVTSDRRWCDCDHQWSEMMWLWSPVIRDDVIVVTSDQSLVIQYQWAQ